ncbi:MAG: replicative DNA helicase, partial [Sphingobacteriales bacterium]
MANKNFAMLPPQVIEAEEFVLSSLLNEPLSYHRISTWISDESFYKEDHKMIFRAIARLHANSRNVDFITVAQSLRETGELEQAGGNYRITELTSVPSNYQNIEEHALVVQQKFLQRQMIRICSEYITKAYTDNDDVFDLYDNVSAELFKQVAVKAGKEAMVLMDILKTRLSEYEKPVANGLSGMGSGYASIDRMTGGWQKSDLIIIAARPAMGKTAFVLNLALNAAIHHKAPVAIFSLEMSKEQLTDRIVSSETGIYLSRIRNRSLEQWQFAKIHNSADMINAPVYIDDTHALSIQAFRSKAIRMKMKYGIQMIVIDYLQLMKGEREN